MSFLCNFAVATRKLAGTVQKGAITAMT